MEYFLDTLKANEFENTTFEKLNKLFANGKALHECMIKNQETKEVYICKLYLSRSNSGAYFWTDNNYNVINNFWTNSLDTSKKLGSLTVTGVRENS